MVATARRAFRDAALLPTAVACAVAACGCATATLNRARHDFYRGRTRSAETVLQKAAVPLRDRPLPDHCPGDLLVVGEITCRRVVQQNAESDIFHAVGLGVYVVADKEPDRCVGLAVVGQSRRELAEHVAVRITQPGSRPIFGIGDDRRAVPAAATVHDERLVQVMHLLGIAELAIRLQVHVPVKLARIGGVLEVERLDPVRTLSVPVREDPPQDLDRRGAVPV